MEITPLLLSNCLSNDIIIDEIYKHLCIAKSPLTPSLRKEIKQTRMYNTIFKGYVHLHGDYNPSDWLENDMLWVLNDGNPLMDGIRGKLKKMFGTFEKLIASRHITRRLWNAMDDDQKIDMYNNVMRALARLTHMYDLNV